MTLKYKNVYPIVQTNYRVHVCKVASHGGISFPRGRGHEPIQLRIPGNGVGEGHQRAANPQQAVPRLGVGDVAHLRVGDMQQFCQLRPVRGRLIEQQQKFRVGQHEPGRLGFQTFLED